MSLNTDETILMGDSVNLAPYGCWEVLDLLEETSVGVVTFRCSICSDLQCAQGTVLRVLCSSQTPEERHRERAPALQ